MTNQLKIWVDEILNEQLQPGYRGTYSNPLPFLNNTPTPIPLTRPFDADGNPIYIDDKGKTLFTQEDLDAIMKAINQPTTP